MPLFALLPMLLVLLFGGVLWLLLVLRRVRFESIGLGRTTEPPPRDTRLALLVVLAYLPLRIAIIAMMGVGPDSSAVYVMQAVVIGNLATVGLFAVCLSAFRTSGSTLCFACGTRTTAARCPACGAVVPPDPPPTVSDEAFGMKWRPLESLRIGFVGLLLAYPLVILAMLASAPLRTVDKIHPFLRTLIEQQNPDTIFWVFVSAAFSAPLAEELVFRVCLQGWLRNRVRPEPAILFVAVLFSAVHGWPDAIGILPLAIVLGFVYERTNDFLAVVFLHGLFNALMTWNTIKIDPEVFRQELEKMRNAAEAAAMF